VNHGIGGPKILLPATLGECKGSAPNSWVGAMKRHSLMLVLIASVAAAAIVSEQKGTVRVLEVSDFY